MFTRMDYVEVWRLWDEGLQWSKEGMHIKALVCFNLFHEKVLKHKSLMQVDILPLMLNRWSKLDGSHDDARLALSSARKAAEQLLFTPEEGTPALFGYICTIGNL